MNPGIEPVDVRSARDGGAGGSGGRALAEALGARSNGQAQWTARCPYHDDTSASLSISEGSDGRPLVHCHAGCEDVFGRLVRDGYLGDTAPSGTARKPEATYQYRDASGDPAYEIVRFPGKEFRPRRLGASGETIWSLPADLRLPYRLPELIGAPIEATIYVVEGEKDADTLAAFGYVATTNPFGAGKGKWLAQYNPHFKGRNVVIIPDNDEPGRKHAEQVRHELEPVATSVRLLSLAGVVEEKGDVSDLIAARGIEALHELLRRLPEPTVRQKPYLTMDDLAKQPRRHWLVEGLVPQQGLVLLYGDSGVGKTFVAIDASVRVAANEPVFGRSVTQGLVFYVALEGQAGLRDRLRAVADETGVQTGDRLPLVVGTRALDLLNPDSVSELIESVRTASVDYDTPAALVVIDTLSRALPGNENSPDDMGKAVRSLTQIGRETGAAVLAIHHAGKDESRGARGHSSLRAALDAELQVKKDAKRRILQVTKQRDGADEIKIPFELPTRTVALPDGSGTVETCVVRASEGQQEQAGTKLSRGAAAASKALRDALRQSGRVLPPEEVEALEIPRGTKVVSKGEWLDACRAAKLATGGEGAFKRARNRAAKELRNAGLLEERGDYCWLIRVPPAGQPGQDSDNGTGQDDPARSKKYGQRSR